MKRPSYREATFILAEDIELDGDVTIGIVAEIFGVMTERLASDVETMRGRIRMQRATGGKP